MTASAVPLTDSELRNAPPMLLTGIADTTDNGRVAVNLDSKVAKAFTKFLRIPDEYEEIEPALPKYLKSLPAWTIPMNIVVQVVGSRGDVQPFVALGNELQKAGHRVRIATHATFKDFVQSANLEFFPIGGNPSDLMAFMVKNPGLIPSMKTIQSGEISKKRHMISDMLKGCWRACIEPDLETGTPFVANAIIANPVSFAHVHCAQALSVPLHMVFTMPWSPTRAFAHPLANLKNTSTQPNIAHYISYSIVQALTWQGLADIINGFRQTLGLQELPTSEAPFVLETLRIPYTYCWSPSLVAKPRDWPEYIDVSGFIFRAPPIYTPSDILQSFLIAGPPPIYIGFGSIVVDNPEILLATVLAAVERVGVRAIISRGWSQLKVPTSKDCFLIDDCPHEWLFKYVSAVVHHGGAGTTACGLLNGRPTAIIPFFGDQPFWGERIAAVGAGPSPIPHKQLNASNLAEAIKFCLTQQAATAAAHIAKDMQTENGVEAAAASFHRHLSAEALRCDIIPTKLAVYETTIKSKKIKLCAAVTNALLKHKSIKPRQLQLYQSSKYVIENRRWDPVTSLTSVTAGQAYDLASGVNGIWYAPYTVRQQARLKNKSEEAPSVSKDSRQRQEDDARAEETAGITARMIGASALSLPKMFGTLLKGVLLDTPYAVTEGFRNTPKLYGEDVAAHRPISDFTSGTIVGGQVFANGMMGAVTDLYVQPRQGAMKDGAKGFATGLAKGSLGMVTKLGAATLGLWSYPMQGLWMTVYNAAHRETPKAILRAKFLHDSYFAERDRLDERQVLDAFDRLVQV